MEQLVVKMFLFNSMSILLHLVYYTLKVAAKVEQEKQLSDGTLKEVFRLVVPEGSSNKQPLSNQFLLKMACCIGLGLPGGQEFTN